MSTGSPLEQKFHHVTPKLHHHVDLLTTPTTRRITYQAKWWKNSNLPANIWSARVAYYHSYHYDYHYHYPRIIIITIITIIVNYSYDDWFISLMGIGPRPPRKHRIREAPICFDHIGVCI